MKKIIPALVAVAVMSIGLTACGDDEECEGAGRSNVGVMSLTDGRSGGSTGGSSSGGSRTGRSGSGTSEGSSNSNSKPSSPKGFKADDDDDCDDD